MLVALSLGLPILDGFVELLLLALSDGSSYTVLFLEATPIDQLLPESSWGVVLHVLLDRQLTLHFIVHHRLEGIGLLWIRILGLVLDILRVWMMRPAESGINIILLRADEAMVVVCGSPFRPFWLPPSP